MKEVTMSFHDFFEMERAKESKKNTKNNVKLMSYASFATMTAVEINGYDFDLFKPFADAGHNFLIWIFKSLYASSVVFLESFAPALVLLLYFTHIIGFKNKPKKYIALIYLLYFLLELFRPMVLAHE